MKIKIFITTYNNIDDVNNCVKSLLDSDVTKENYEINVLNNHTNFICHYPLVKVYNNQTRPDFSTGHLSRTWNQCIINGFKDISSPDCDILVTLQDDVILKPNWFSLILPHIQKYSFMEVGGGDIMCVYTPKAIYNVGLWDERFCNIGYQEADYFLRQLVYNPDIVSINDYCHSRVHNPIYASSRAREIDNEFLRVPAKNSTRVANSNLSLAYHGHSENMFRSKWSVPPENWNVESILNNIKTPNVNSYVLYPYFEYKLNTNRLRDMQKFNF